MESRKTEDLEPKRWHCEEDSAGFEDERRGRKPRNEGRPWTSDKMDEKMESRLEPLEGTQTCLILAQGDSLWTSDL